MLNLTQMLMQKWGRTAVRQATNRHALLLTTSAMMAMLLVGCDDIGDPVEEENHAPVVVHAVSELSMSYNDLNTYSIIIRATDSNNDSLSIVFTELDDFNLMHGEQPVQEDNLIEMDRDSENAFSVTLVHSEEDPVFPLENIINTMTFHVSDGEASSDSATYKLIIEAPDAGDDDVDLSDSDDVLDAAFAQLELGENPTKAQVIAALGAPVDGVVLSVDIENFDGSSVVIQISYESEDSESMILVIAETYAANDDPLNDDPLDVYYAYLDWDESGDMDVIAYVDLSDSDDVLDAAFAQLELGENPGENPTIDAIKNALDAADEGVLSVEIGDIDNPPYAFIEIQYQFDIEGHSTGEILFSATGTNEEGYATSLWATLAPDTATGEITLDIIEEEVSEGYYTVSLGSIKSVGTAPGANEVTMEITALEFADLFTGSHRGGNDNYDVYAGGVNVVYTLSSDPIVTSVFNPYIGESVNAPSQTDGESISSVTFASPSESDVLFMDGDPIEFIVADDDDGDYWHEVVLNIDLDAANDLFEAATTPEELEALQLTLFSELGSLYSAAGALYLDFNDGATAVWGMDDAAVSYTFGAAVSIHSYDEYTSAEDHTSQLDHTVTLDDQHVASGGQYPANLTDDFKAWPYEALLAIMFLTAGKLEEEQGVGQFSDFIGNGMGIDPAGVLGDLQITLGNIAPLIAAGMDEDLSLADQLVSIKSMPEYINLLDGLDGFMDLLNGGRPATIGFVYANAVMDRLPSDDAEDAVLECINADESIFFTDTFTPVPYVVEGSSYYESSFYEIGNFTATGVTLSVADDPVDLDLDLVHWDDSGGTVINSSAESGTSAETLTGILLAGQVLEVYLFVAPDPSNEITIQFDFTGVDCDI